MNMKKIWVKPELNTLSASNTMLGSDITKNSDGAYMACPGMFLWSDPNDGDS